MGLFLRITVEAVSSRTIVRSAEERGFEENQNGGRCQFTVDGLGVSWHLNTSTWRPSSDLSTPQFSLGPRLSNFGVEGGKLSHHLDTIEELRTVCVQNQVCETGKENWLPQASGDDGMKRGGHKRQALRGHSGSRSRGGTWTAPAYASPPPAPVEFPKLPSWLQKSQIPRCFQRPGRARTCRCHFESERPLTSRREFRENAFARRVILSRPRQIPSLGKGNRNPQRLKTPPTLCLLCLSQESRRQAREMLKSPGSRGGI